MTFDHFGRSLKLCQPNQPRPTLMDAVFVLLLGLGATEVVLVVGADGFEADPP